MDSAILAMREKGRNRHWAESMVNLEARKLLTEANKISSFHLKDGLIRMKFTAEIKTLIEQQFEMARRARTDEECMACVANLRAETSSLQEQDKLLRTRAAQLYAKIEFVRENNKIVGYVISAVQLALSGAVLIGGAIMLATMPAVGMLAGAVLVVDGINGITREVSHIRNGGTSQYEGVMAHGATELAQFMGFKAESGLALYNSVSLVASVYSIVGLTRKTAAWRLFRWVPRDYYRQVDNMSKSKLTMKIVGYGVKAKIIFDLLSTEAPTN